MLDLGCGSGLETLVLQKKTGIQTIGIDVNSDFDPEASEQVELCRYNGRTIPYPDAYFDGVYSFHVLEHVQNPNQLIREITRILRPGGFAYFGVPNRTRMIAYFGIPGKEFSAKLKQNLIDYWDRLRGRFRNELGAHAGFSENGLLNLLSGFFAKMHPVTSDYYGAKWQYSKKLFNILPKRVIWPSVYVLCIK